VNVSELALRAYAPNKVAVQTPRSTEAKLLSQVTSQLQRLLDGRGSFADLAEAVHRNREMWTILAGDVADPANELPEMLRAQIFYLAEFTHDHSQKVLREDASVAPLIDINTAILRGLNGTGASN
jgi:flagellar protein FlaF